MADPATQPLFGAEITNAKKLIDLMIEFCVKYSFQVLGGILVLLLGWFVAKFVAKFLKKFLEKHKVDVTVAKFLITITKLLVVAFAALIALGKFGITIAPFIAGLSVIGFGTSFALQGPLSNYAAGITLIFTKPFKVGDIIMFETCRYPGVARIIEINSEAVFLKLGLDSHISSSRRNGLVSMIEQIKKIANSVE